MRKKIMVCILLLASFNVSAASKIPASSWIKLGGWLPGEMLTDVYRKSKKLGDRVRKLYDNRTWVAKGTLFYKSAEKGTVWFQVERDRDIRIEDVHWQRPVHFNVGGRDYYDFWYEVSTPVGQRGWVQGPYIHTNL